MNKIVPFNFENRELRVLDDGAGSFEVVAKDVVEGLGATWNGNAAVAHVPAEWKGVRSVLTPGGTQEMATLTESGLYFYLGRSDKPTALPMQKWVAGEVLPSIRKTGGYSSHKTSKPSPASLAYREAAAITRDHLRVCKLLGVDEGMAKAVTAKQVKLATGLDFAPLLATNVTLDVPMTPTQLAERMGGGAAAAHVNAALRDLGMQEQQTSAGRGGKTKKKWVLTAAGEQYGSMQPYQGDGSEHSGYRPMWFARAIELIRPMLEMQGAYRAKAKEPDAAAA